MKGRWKRRNGGAKDREPGCMKAREMEENNVKGMKVKEKKIEKLDDRWKKKQMQDGDAEEEVTRGQMKKKTFNVKKSR